MQIDKSIPTTQRQAGLYQIKITLYVTADFKVYESFYILTIEIVGEETESIEDKKDEKNEKKEDDGQGLFENEEETPGEADVKGPEIAVEKTKEKEINEQKAP